MVSDKLMQAVKDQLGDSWKSDFQDIVNHGIDGGFGGFIYYSDTCKFFEDNKTEILALVKDMAEEFGQNVIEFISSFNCLKGDDWTDEIGRAVWGNVEEDDTIIPNALAWFAGEEAARQWMDEHENDSDDEDDEDGEDDN